MAIGHLSSLARRGEGLPLAIALLASPMIVRLLLWFVPSLDFFYESSHFHVLVVSAIAACAVGVGAVAAVAAARSKSASLVFLALGCLWVGVPMLGHGLTTPGIAGMPMNSWIGRLPQLAIAGFAVCQAAALMRPDRGLAKLVARHPWASLAVPAAALFAGVAVVVAAPTTAPGSHAMHNEATWTNLLQLSSGIILVGVGAVHWRRWRLSRDTAQFALVLASLMSAESLISFHFGRFWHLSWWDYHVLLLVGFATAVYAIVAGYLKSRALMEGLGAAFKIDPLDHIARGYPESLKALVAAVEARDSYTKGHTDRVTEYAVRIGQRMGLRPKMLRRLAWGAAVHDIGKIGIPDWILHKEGPLTPDERALIEEHPSIGWEIARQARSLNEILGVVRHHHERIDGTGYPDKLKGEEIPLNARIVAVADVWDALTSDRSYRPAWPLDRALQIMAEGKGTQFDERCLAAFFDVLVREHGVEIPAAVPAERELAALVQSAV